MPKLILRYCTIENPKADFLKHHIKFSVALPLTDDNLRLRDKFELLAGEKKSVTVEIESAQLPLFGGDVELQNIAERAADEAVPPERKVESGTLTGENVFDAVVDTLEEERNAPAADGKRGRARQGGTVTISHGNRSVTLTNEQFSHAAKNAGRKPRK